MTGIPDDDETNQLARELLAVSSNADPDPEMLASVRRQLDAVRDVLRFDASNAPSSAALRRAEAIFPPSPAESGQPTTERLRAVLTFDSRTVRPGFGFRGGAAATMLRYEVGDLLIDLEVRPSALTDLDRVDVTGQIDGGPSGPIWVELRTPGGDVAAAGAQDELGTFKLTVPPGAYNLVARVGTLEVSVFGIGI